MNTLFSHYTPLTQCSTVTDPHRSVDPQLKTMALDMTFNPLSNKILGAQSQLSPSFLKVTLVHITSQKILILC